MKDWIEKKLIKEIGLERFNHSVGVMNLSIELATMYGCDCNKAKQQDYYMIVQNIGIKYIY